MAATEGGRSAMGLFLLIMRRGARNAPLTLAVLVGMLVLVTLLVSAPLYLAALEDAGLRATLADAPLDQRGIRAVVSTTRLQQSEHARLVQLLGQAGQEAAWLKPTLLGAIRAKTLLLPGGYGRGGASLVEASAAPDNLRVIEGRLPRMTGPGEALEVVLGPVAAEALALRVGDQETLSERTGSAPVIRFEVVGLVEPDEPAATFWQSDILDLEPTVSATRREAPLVVAPGALWTAVVPRFPAGRAAGEYRWRIVFDLGSVDRGNVMVAGADISRVVQRTQQALDSANVSSDFGQIVADYRRRLGFARAPLLLLFVEIAGLALIYLGWTAAFQAEATANEQAVMSARGAAVRQIVAASGGLAVVLGMVAALAGIPLALLLIRVTARLGPLAALQRLQGLRLQATLEAQSYALAASAAGALALVVPAIPAARRSITALRQDTARPATLPFWQRSYLDLLVVVVAVVALARLEQQGSLFQRLRGQSEIDPFLVVAPFLILVAGALLFLRLYPWLLRLAQALTIRHRGFALSLALVQLTRNRAASTRLVLLLSLTAALGLFTQTFGANLALNQQRRAGYLVGADGRAGLRDSRPLLPGGLPAGVRGVAALRETVVAAGGSTAPAALLAIDPERFADVAFNPADHPILPLDALLQALGPTPPTDGLLLPGQPQQMSLTLELGEAPYRPSAIFQDVAGTFYRRQFTPVTATGPSETFTAAIDLPAAAFPVRLVTLGLLPTDRVDWGPGEQVQPAISVTLGALAVDGTIVEQWDGVTGRWQATPDALVDPREPAAGAALLRGSSLTISRGRQTRAVMLRLGAQQLAPVPVAVDERFLRVNNLQLGSAALFYLRNRQIPVWIAAVLPRFPSLGDDAAPFVVAHGPILLRFLNSSFAPLIVPNELWLDLPDDVATTEQTRRTPGIGTLLLQTTVLRSLSREPLAIGIAGVFFLGFVTSMGLTALGFALALYLASRRRTVEFAVLQALGFDRRGLLATLAIEQAVLVTLALLAGTGMGFGLGRLILPLMAIGDGGQIVVPPPLVIVPWRALTLTYAALIALFAVVTMLVLTLLLRRGIGSALRLGEE